MTMEIYSILGSATTVVSFIVFLGIVGWAWSGRRAASFESAAREPFALPDEIGAPSQDAGTGAER